MKNLDRTDWTAIIIFSVLIIVTGIVILALLIFIQSQPSDFQRVQNFLQECQEATDWTLNECWQLWTGKLALY